MKMKNKKEAMYRVWWASQKGEQQKRAWGKEQLLSKHQRPKVLQKRHYNCGHPPKYLEDFVSYCKKQIDSWKNKLYLLITNHVENLEK